VYKTTFGIANIWSVISCTPCGGGESDNQSVPCEITVNKQRYGNINVSVHGMRNENTKLLLANQVGNLI